MNRTIPRVALLLGLLPILVININYLIAASEGYVPWCVPYWDSCTSISATGREGSAFFFFKATMIPLAFLNMQYWKLANENLEYFGFRGKSIQNLGIIASVALIVYTLALGAVGDNFQLTRRIGIIFYFTLTYLNQLLVVYQLEKRQIADRSKHWQVLMCIVILSLGILTLLLDAILDNYDDYEDAFEWVLGILIHCNFLIAYKGWQSVIHGSKGMNTKTMSADDDAAETEEREMT